MAWHETRQKEGEMARNTVSVDRFGALSQVAAVE
jgi:hypothetical protein